MSTYYRAFSVIDMLSLMVVIIRQICVFLWPARSTDLALAVVYRLMATLYNFCPLFLAMDRCLIVSFPHNFCKYERRMRLAKRGTIFVVATLIFTSALIALGEQTTTAILIHHGISIATLVLQIVGIVGLYCIIIAKVLRSDQEMKKNRHIGNM